MSASISALKKYDRANKAAGALYSLMMIFAAFIALLGVIYPLALNYIRVIFIGLPFSFTLFAFNFLLRAVGDTMLLVLLQLCSPVA